MEKAVPWVYMHAPGSTRCQEASRFVTECVCPAGTVRPCRQASAPNSIRTLAEFMFITVSWDIISKGENIACTGEATFHSALFSFRGQRPRCFFCNQGPECTCNADVSWLLKTPCIHVSPVIVLMVWQFLTRETKVYMPVTNEMCVPCPEGLDCQTGADEKDTWRKKNWGECGRWILKNMSLHIDDV